jgi:hypothetical protein
LQLIESVTARFLPTGVFSIDRYSPKGTT